MPEPHDVATPTLTADEFERAYAERSHVTLEQLREYRTVRPCHCDAIACEGWQSISHARAAAYDAAPDSEKHLA